MSPAKLELYFSDSSDPLLYQICFTEDPSFKPTIGLNAVSVTGSVTFRWSVGTKALAIFFLKAKLVDNVELSPILSGFNGSPAASLDYLLWSPSVTWIQDIFGVKRNGVSIARRIIQMVNSRQKQSKRAPVMLYLNSAFLAPEDINVYLDNVELQNKTAVAAIFERIEKDWKPVQSSKVVSLPSRSKSALKKAVGS